MILSSLDYCERYFPLHQRFAEAFSFLRDEKTAKLEDGRYEISGKDIFALVFRIDGKKKEDAKIETHRKYLDIQFVAAGVDQMGWAPYFPAAPISTPYNEEKDVELYQPLDLHWLSVKAGQFAIFYPDDIHAPGISDGRIHKIVIKIRVS